MMRRPRHPDAPVAALLACVLGVATAHAQVAVSEDRLLASINGSTLTDTNGGGGGSFAWLHEFNADTIGTLGVEHQVLAGSEWTFGSLSLSYTAGPDDARFGIYGEAHLGSGTDPQHFDYRIEAIGLSGTFSHKLSALLEDRQIDVQTTHGNLPKVGLSYLWTPHLQTGVSYQYTVSGNLGTRITSVRLDLFGSTLSGLAGVAFGQGAPAIFGVLREPGSAQAVNGEILPARQLHEEYLGLTKPVPSWRSDFTLLFDYLDLGGIKRGTITLSYVYHLPRTS